MKIKRFEIVLLGLTGIASLVQNSMASADTMPYLSGVTDQGIVLRPDAVGGANYTWDGGGVREANINREGATYYMYYDGAATFGEYLWRACLATSTDLVHWTKQGKKLNAAIDDDPTGSAKGYRDWKSASSPWIIKEGSTYYMFYLGCLTVFGGGIPSSPYYTLLAPQRASAAPGQNAMQHPAGKSTSRSIPTPSMSVPLRGALS
jgi:beta-xylosidase